MEVIKTRPRRLIVAAPRIGQFGVCFSMYKFSLGELTGMDESAQLLNVANRTMNIFGWRPLEPPEHADFMDDLDDKTKARYEREVLTTKPGIISSFALRYHADHLPEINSALRAEANLADARRLKSARGRLEYIAYLSRIALCSSSAD